MMAPSQEEAEFKLPLRRWLIKKTNDQAFQGLEWMDTNKSMLKIPWTPMHHPGWETTYKIYIEWAKHKGKYDENQNPIDYKRLKGNFRCALHKSTDFEEVKDDVSMNMQTGNYKMYRLLSPGEVKAKTKDKKKHTSNCRRARSSQSSSINSPEHHDTNQAHQANVFPHGSSLELHEVDAGQMILGWNAVQQEVNSSHGIDLMLDQPPLITTPPIAPLNDQGSFMQNVIVDKIERPMTSHLQALNSNLDFDQITNMSLESGEMSFIHNVPSSDLLPSPETNMMSPEDAYMEEDKPTTSVEQQHPSLRVFLEENFIPWESLFKVDVKFRYGKTIVNHCQLDLSMGARLSYGNVAMQEEIMNIMKRNPCGFNFTSVSMPPYEGSNRHVREVLDKTDQGFVLKIDQNAVLRVTRLCQSQMFFFEAGSDASASPVKLERYKPVEVFSYNKYVIKLIEQMKNSIDRRPSTAIRLFIGSKPRTRSSDGIVCVTIEPASIDDIYEKFSIFESNLAFSAENSLDVLLRALECN